MSKYFLRNRELYISGENNNWSKQLLKYIGYPDYPASNVLFLDFQTRSKSSKKDKYEAVWFKRHRLWESLTNFSCALFNTKLDKNFQKRSLLFKTDFNNDVFTSFPLFQFQPTVDGILFHVWTEPKVCPLKRMVHE